MPRRGKKKGRPGELDTLRFPVAWLITQAGAYTTLVKTLTSVFDRTRAFRISRLEFEASIDGDKPFIIQWKAFSPVSAVDAVWASPLLLISREVRRGSYAIPESETLWFPSDVVSTTPLLQLVVTCESSSRTPAGICQGYLTVVMGPWEDSGSCDQIVVRADDVSFSSSWPLLPRHEGDDGESQPPPTGGKPCVEP